MHDDVAQGRDSGPCSARPRFLQVKGDIDDIVPWIRLLVSEGWWMTGQTVLVNGGYTTK